LDQPKHSPDEVAAYSTICSGKVYAAGYPEKFADFVA